MGWKIVEIENSQRLSLFLDNLVIFNSENEKIHIPIKNIDVLLINNFKCNLSVQLMNKLSESNILSIICDNNYLPCSLIVPIIGNYNTLKVLECQLNWNHKWKSKIWKDIIFKKISNQIELIKNINASNNSIDLLEQLKNNIKDYDVTNREGHASKIYWHNLFGLSFKRFDDDYVNKLLNYGYTILRGYFTRSIIKKGLDPRISIFHKSFHNYFALSSDLMEPFRIIVDNIVYKIYLTGEIDFYNHKQEILEFFNNKIEVNGKLYFINKSIDLFVDSIINQSKLPELNFNGIF